MCMCFINLNLSIDFFHKGSVETSLECVYIILYDIPILVHPEIIVICRLSYSVYNITLPFLPPPPPPINSLLLSGYY